MNLCASRHRYLGLIIYLLLHSGISCGQRLPDAGALQQQLERDNSQPLPAVVKPLLTPSKPLAPAQGEATIIVKAFVFKGKDTLPHKALQASVQGYLNRPLTIAELKNVAAIAAEFYRQRGWLVRAFLPRQDVTEGTVTIEIVAAQFVGAKVDMPPQNVSAERLEKTVAAAISPDQPLLIGMERGLRIADDLPGVNVSGRLQPGQNEGETEMALSTTPEPLWNGVATLDNAGERGTGDTRINALGALNSPLHAGDQLFANAVHSEGLNYGFIDYSVPVGYSGLRAGINASALNYDLIGDDFASLDAYGTSNTMGISTSYPLLRASEQNLYISGGVDKKYYDNHANGETSSDYEIDSYFMSISGNRLDNLGAGGVINGSLRITRGDLDLSGSPTQSADALTTLSNGTYTKLNYSIDRLQSLSSSLILSAAFSGQLASKNLDSYEKFYLGGAYGVRAYPNSEGGGTEGQLLTIELRKQLPHSFQLTGFYDWGRVTINKFNDFAGNAKPNTYELQGVGLNLSWSNRTGAELNAGWARRIDDNPNAADNGDDQDGSYQLNRFWLSASQAF
jgi:hemolysin activation/secretion protein